MTDFRECSYNLRMSFKTHEDKFAQSSFHGIRFPVVEKRLGYMGIKNRIQETNFLTYLWN